MAGAQDKLPVYIKGAQFYLPKNSGSATTHIIKPINAGFIDIPRNEAFCMELAQRSGFSIPNSKIMKIGGHELYVVDRYDRFKSKQRNCSYSSGGFFVKQWGIRLSGNIKRQVAPGF